MKMKIHFTLGIVALLGVAANVAQAQHNDPNEADDIYFGGPIVTVNNAQPVVHIA